MNKKFIFITLQLVIITDMANSAKEPLRLHTATYALERQLKEINERYELAAKATNDAMYDYDIQKGTVIWNDAIHTHYGHTRSPEIIPLEWWASHVHPDDALRIEAEISDWLASDRDTWQSEYRFMRGDGTYAEVRDRGFLQRSPNGEPLRIIGTLLDITEQRQLDRAKDEFISLVSHQLRTPLTIIRTYSDMFADGFFGQLQPEQLCQAKRITDASTRLIELISDMLSLSRIEMGRVQLRPVATDINKLILDYLSEFSPIVNEKSLTVSFQPDSTLSPVHIDTTLFGQVIYNLIENAIRYTHAGGTITVSFSQTTRGHLLTVSDTGIGIPVDEQKHIFERFFRANNAPNTNPDGTGLGLYLVKLVIVDTYGGKVWCKSHPSKGTTMHVLVPPSTRNNIH